jgi:hypothetical protein
MNPKVIIKIGFCEMAINDKIGLLHAQTIMYEERALMMELAGCLVQLHGGT